MWVKYEDVLGKVLLAAAFAAIALRQVLALIALAHQPLGAGVFGMVVATQIMTLGFIGLTIWLTLRRLPPRGTARGLMPRVTALLGTFFMLLLALLPPWAGSMSVALFALGLIFVGSALSIYCVRALGRSFSIVATARRLVTSGPYGVVRHPLYLAEAISMIGVIILHLSPAAILLGLVEAALQLSRMRMEEAVLTEAFPDYTAYARRVPMLVPRLWGRTEEVAA